MRNRLIATSLPTLGICLPRDSVHDLDFDDDDLEGGTVRTRKLVADLQLLGADLLIVSSITSGGSREVSLEVLGNTLDGWLEDQEYRQLAAARR